MTSEGVALKMVETFGGRFSAELGIDVDAGDAEVERWFVAATLYGTRISARIAGRAFKTLDRAGLVRIALAGEMSWDSLVARLDEAGYARYDFRTATRLQDLAKIVIDSYGGRIATIGATCDSYVAVRQALDALPGWGPVTIQLFLRELRGVWPGADPPLDSRAASAGRHVGLFDASPSFAQLAGLAAAARLDERDLESGLVRASLARHDEAACPGGSECTLLAAVR